ncbi:MAG: hypothetical protein ACR2QR_08525 [Woeseiaceae bacterium]
MKITRTTVILILATYGFAGCNGGGSSENADEASSSVSAGKSVPGTGTMSEASPGKLGAPVDISYEVVGNAFVGVPVAVNIRFDAAEGPLDVKYSINDASAVMFQDGQVEQLQIVDPGVGGVQQITVIPQREGRIYVNVSVEVPADFGTMIRSIAIPINVGTAAKETTVNGELKQGPDDEAVISMPAQETN